MRMLLAVFLFWGGAIRSETLRLATYNVRDYGLFDRMTADGFRKAYPKPEAEKHDLRQVIRALNADLLALEEMGGQPYLDELRNDLRAEGLDYPYATLVRGADPGRMVALMSRRPLLRVRPHADLFVNYHGSRQAVKRGLLEASIATSAGELTIFVVHLKSQLTERRDDLRSVDLRAAEAAAVRDCILARFPKTDASRFVILGDCNDGTKSRTLRLLEHRGKTPVVYRLPAADSRGETWTELDAFDDEYSVLDHILVSSVLRTQVRGGVARIYDGAGAAEASDHRPVYVDLSTTSQASPEPTGETGEKEPQP
jgi:endonuclease/exonuclease/phosphatase family metal-dependent hydrolase